MNIIEKNGIKGNIKTIYYFVLRLEQLDIEPHDPNTRLFIQEGLPSKKFVDELVEQNSGDVMIVIDDQWRDCIKNKQIDRLIFHDRRHIGYTLIFVAQNYFEQRSGGNPITMK